MRIEIFITIFLFSLLLSCTPSVQIIGKYESTRPSRAELAIHWLRGSAIVAGSSLEVNEDSSYLYTTCGNIVEGKWRVRDGLLLLYPQSNRWRNDSLHANGRNGLHPKVATEIQEWHIGEHYIEMRTSLNEKNGRVTNLYSKLDKTDYD